MDHTRSWHLHIPGKESSGSEDRLPQHPHGLPKGQIRILLYPCTEQSHRKHPDSHPGSSVLHYKKLRPLLRQPSDHRSYAIPISSFTNAKRTALWQPFLHGRNAISHFSLMKFRYAMEASAKMLYQRILWPAIP